MKQVSPLSLATIDRLVDFGANRISSSMAREQLEGTTALYNTLARHRVAYLADEVGMGKTYMALAVCALLQHQQPGARVLFVAPRENLQDKWIKERRNFVAHNWRHRDQVIRSLRDTPVIPSVRCSNLQSLAREVVRDPDRDVFVRMTSFSFSLSQSQDAWNHRRSELAKLAPSIEVERWDLDVDKRSFKRQYALQLHQLLPHFDLVIVDEAHNLKGGHDPNVARNQLLALILGTAPNRADLAGYRPRFDRLLLLSATPIESDYTELWNQLDLFGRGDAFPELKDSDVSEPNKKELAQTFLVRRLTSLSVGDERLTRNQYRREWRAGGISEHDEPLEVPGAHQRLIVALVQKKVAEVLKDARFGARFQLGMLASFESFLQTARANTRYECVL